MKLLTAGMKGKGWDQILPEDEQRKWIKILKGFCEFTRAKIIQRLSKIRLICLADAAEFAGGAGVYAGMELE